MPTQDNLNPEAEAHLNGPLFQNAIKTFDEAAKIINCDPNISERLRRPRRVEGLRGDELVQRDDVGCSRRRRRRGRCVGSWRGRRRRCGVGQHESRHNPDSLKRRSPCDYQAARCEHANPFRRNHV